MTDSVIASLLSGGKPNTQGQSALASTTAAKPGMSLAAPDAAFEGAIEQAFQKLNPKTGATLPPQLLALLQSGKPSGLQHAAQHANGAPFMAWNGMQQTGETTGPNNSPLQQLLDAARAFMDGASSNEDNNEKQPKQTTDAATGAEAAFFPLPVRVEQTETGTLLADGIAVTPETTDDGRQNLPPLQRALAALDINTRRLDLLLQQAGVNLNDYTTPESLRSPHFQRALTEVLHQNGADSSEQAIQKIMTFVAQIQENPQLIATLAKPATDQQRVQPEELKTPSAPASKDKHSPQTAGNQADATQPTATAAVKDLSESMKSSASVAAPNVMAQSQMPQDQASGNTPADGSGVSGIESLGDGQPTAQTGAPQNTPAAPKSTGGATAHTFAHHLHETGVRDQVTVRIQQAVKEGVDKIAIKLQPAELGKVDITIEMAGDGISRLSVTADNRVTLDMLQRSARELEKSLLDAGLKADSGSLSFNLRGDGQPQNPFAQGNNDKYPNYGHHKDGMDEDEALAAIQGNTAGRLITINADELNIVI